MKQRWDRWSIIAEIKRKGSSLKKLSAKAELDPSSCSHALRTHTLPAAEKVISDFLEVPPQELWPDRYFKNGNRRIISNRTKQDNEKNVTCKCIKQQAA